MSARAISMPKTEAADRAIATLRAHEAELRGRGIAGLSLFGSVARGDATQSSDIDLAAELDPDARVDLFGLSALERLISTWLGRPTDLLPEPVDKARLQARIDRDRRRVF